MLDFYTFYICGCIQIVLGFYCFIKWFQKKIHILSFLSFAVPGTAFILLTPSRAYLPSIVFILCLTATGILYCHAAYSTAISYAVLAVVMMQLNFGIIDSLSGILQPLTFSLPPEAAALFILAFGLLPLPMSILCCRAVTKYLPADGSPYSLLFLTPHLFIFIIGRYISTNIYGNTTVRTTSGNTVSARHCQMLVVQLLAAASLFCVLFAYKKLTENFHLQTRLSLLEQEGNFLRQYVNEAKERYSRTKSFRHDLKNHMTVLTRLLESGYSQKALEYIGEMDHLTGDMSFSCHTNNPVLDILIGNKLGIAKSEGIEIQCSLLLPNPCSVRDIDLCILFSNALDNALAACAKMKEGARKYIYVSGHVQGDFIFLDIQNSFENNAPILPGTGLSNIKTVVEKYKGAMNIQTDSSCFDLSILLIHLPQPKNIPQHLASPPDRE